jgi:hypothetical protein
LRLNGRVARLEVKTSPSCPTGNELREAHQLLDRHFAAIHAPTLFGAEWRRSPPDPAEVALMHEAEASGRTEAARDVVRRHARAHGRDDPYPTSPEEREKRRKAVLAQFDAAFGLGHWRGVGGQPENR